MENPSRGHKIRIIRKDENLWADLKLPPKPPMDPERVKQILELERRYVFEYLRLEGKSL